MINEFQTHHEFDTDGLSIRRPGLTSLQAQDLMRKTFPSTKKWMGWCVGDYMDQVVIGLIPVGKTNRGKIGQWSWRRISGPYPVLGFWNMNTPAGHRMCNWTGTIKVSSPEGHEFIVLSYMTSSGRIGSRYMVSTTDANLLQDFLDACRMHFIEDSSGKTRVFINVINGQDITLDPDDEETIFLPNAMKQDIDRQVDVFFRNPEIYRQHGIPHRRGFLFVGPPGTGKTMTVRQILRRVWKEFRPCINLLKATGDMEERTLAQAFHWPKDKLAVVILEDMDAFAQSPRLTRASLLSHLDGVEPSRDVLVIGTTNNPGDVDPALTHRPSRFDRVWLFDTPDGELRMRYIRHAFPLIEEELAIEIVSRTRNWSFAYLNELRTTAAILAVHGFADDASDDPVLKALSLLDSQFEAGRKNHVIPPHESEVGFLVA